MAKVARLNTQEIRRALSQYLIGEVINLQRLRGGFANTSFIVTAGTGRFVLTIVQEKSSEGVHALVRLLTHLEEHEFPTSRVMRNCCGGYITEHNAELIMLKRYIPGEPPSRISPRVISEMGLHLGLLHCTPLLEGLPKEHPYGHSFFDELTDVEAYRGFAHWLQSRHKYISEEMPCDLPRGLIHGDVFPDNTLFAGESLQAIIDFEEACDYFYMFDVGMTLVGLLSRGLQYDDVIDPIKEGYRKARSMSALEEESIPFFAHYSAVATAFWRFRQHNVRQPNSRLKDSHQDMIAMAQHISRRAGLG